MNNYDRIKNPNTGRWVSINNNLGKKIINSYVKQTGGSMKVNNLTQKGGVVRQNLFKENGFKQIMEEMVKTMRSYPVRNFDFHTGDDVADHSIWSALAVKNWIKEKNSWVKKLLAKYRDIAVFAAFMHDIGKVGDGDYTTLLNPGWKDASSAPPGHEQAGFEYLLGNRKFISYSLDIQAVRDDPYGHSCCNQNKQDKKGTTDCVECINGPKDGEWYPKTTAAKHFDKGINLRNYLLSAELTEEEVAICAISAGMHYEFGNLVVIPIGSESRPGKLYDDKLTAYNNYINKFKKLLKEVVSGMTNKELNVEQAFIICILISAADVRGSNLVEGDLGYDAVSNYPTKPVKGKTSADDPVNNYSLFNYEQNVEHLENLLERFHKK